MSLHTTRALLLRMICTILAGASVLAAASVSVSGCASARRGGEGRAYRGGANFGGHSADISPDGNTIVFVGVSTDPPRFWPYDDRTYEDSGDIYSIRRDGTDLRRLTRNRCYDGMPAFSPDGREIVYVSEQGSCSGREAIWLMNSDGTSQKPLTDHKYRSFYPFFSPSGEKIVFTRTGWADSEGNLTVNPFRALWDHAYAVFVMNRDGSRITEVTTPSGSPDWPHAWGWFPDGKRILIRRDSVFWALDLTDGIERPLARGNFAPVRLSASGNKLVAVRERSDLIVLDIATCQSETIAKQPYEVVGIGERSLLEYPVFFPNDEEILVFATPDAAKNRGLGAYWIYNRPRHKWRKLTDNYRLLHKNNSADCGSE